MVPANKISILKRHADKVIGDCMRNGGTTPNGTVLQPPTKEVEALQVVMFCAARRIAHAWGHALRRTHRLHLTAVLTHNTPKTQYSSVGPGYAYAARLPAKVSGVWSCELADLLVVMDFRQSGGHGLSRQAALVQAKIGTPQQFYPREDEVKQHHLMTCWPTFDLDKAKGFRKGPRVLHGLPTQAAVYGMVEVPWHQGPDSLWTMCKPRPRGGYLRPSRDTLGEWLAELAAGQEGHPADTTPVRMTHPSRRTALSWRQLVAEILRVTAKETVKAGGVEFRRGQSNVVQMLDATSLKPQIEVETFDPHQKSNSVWPSSSRSGAGLSGTSVPEPYSDGEGTFCVIYIRFDPVEG